MKLARINSLLLIAIILVNAYIIVMPVMPAFLFWLSSGISGTEARLTYELTAPLSPETDPVGPGHRLVIPKLHMDQPIHEGSDLHALSGGGTWRRPHTSTPDKGSNTVIVGHRFTYTNPRGSFYHLDKLKVGDQVGTFWDGKRYIYKVQEISIVPPNKTEVEASTADERLTLYTCAPLWLPRDRLVITAVLERTL